MNSTESEEINSLGVSEERRLSSAMGDDCVPEDGNAFDEGVLASGGLMTSATVCRLGSWWWWW